MRRSDEIEIDLDFAKAPEAEIFMRARGVGYNGAGLRVSLGQRGEGSSFSTKKLAEDGSWTDLKFTYHRRGPSSDRVLVLRPQSGTGTIEIDDVQILLPGMKPRAKAPGPSAPSQTPPSPAPAPAPAAPASKPQAAVPVPAQQTSSGEFTSLEQMLASAPPDSVRKLQSAASRDAGIAEINAHLEANVKGKRALLDIPVERVEDVAAGASKFRVKAAVDTLEANAAGATKVWLWLYFRESALGDKPWFVPGAQVKVSGFISRCDLKATPELRLNVDINQARYAP